MWTLYLILKWLTIKAIRNTETYEKFKEGYKEGSK